MASGKKTVIAALVGNSFIGICKFIAWGFSGSGAMLSEGIHSLADVSNQALLLLGIKRSEGEANQNFAYGHGAERYFWALISAVGIFFLGCGVTIYHGIEILMDEHASHPGIWDYSILGLSLVVEGWTLKVAIDGLREDKGDMGWLEFIRKSPDPAPIAVLLEDAAACLGLVIALVGIALSEILHSHVPDGVASILIGVLLGFVAIFLIYKNHGFIVGKRVDSNVREDVISYLNEQDTVERILDFKSRIISAQRYQLKMEVEFHGSELAKKILAEKNLAEIRESIKSDEDLEKFLIAFSDNVVDALGDEIDRIESDIQKKFPRAHHIDIEAD